ncbi:MAG: ABC transporter permease [Acetatifactor sp.]|nr:ABC transporter permease [Acetatifactor sp.]
MSKKIYAKLAWTAVRKNKQLYYPYLIAGITVAAVFYILSFLSMSDIVGQLKGSDLLSLLLHYAANAVGWFSVPFLFYTNSTLLKRRKKELGLYNILGMNKKNIFFVLAWETLMTYSIVMFLGVFAGIVFSKIAELGMLGIMGQEVDYYIYIEWKAVLNTLLAFAGIYVLLLLNILRQIHHNDPIELLHSESSGERPPKSRWLPAVIGVLFLLVGYILSNTMKYNMDAKDRIPYIACSILIGTYLLFICVSVFLCRLLQRSKRYYYKTAHFVMVSSMSYRMKRNGASLASICILVSAILVALVGTVSFFAGVNTIIAGHYPYDMGIIAEIPAEHLTDELNSSTDTSAYRNEMQTALKEQNVTTVNTTELYSADMMGFLKNGQLDFSIDTQEAWNGVSSLDYFNRDELAEDEEIVFVRIIGLEDYNKWCGTSEALSEGEILIASENMDYLSQTVVLPDKTEIMVENVVNTVPSMTALLVSNKYSDVEDAGIFYLVVADLREFLTNTYHVSAYPDSNRMVYRWEYGMNLPDDYDRQLEIQAYAESKLQSVSDTLGMESVTLYSHVEKVDRVKTVAGGSMFIMIILNIMFTFVTALIMYYKQISEGYEDQKRFAIMRKIGMTAQEIKQSINSQMLTVFGMPLLVAGIHLVLTLDVVHRMMSYALMDDKPLIIRVMIISFFLFTIVYSIVYMLTSRTYFKIVNRSANE